MARNIKPTLPKKINTALMVADIETDKNGALLDIGFYSASSGFKIFETWDDLIEFLPEKSQVWFHNGGRFDAVNALHYIHEKMDWTASIAGSTIVRLEINPKKIIFSDSASLFQSSLDETAKAFCKTFHKKVIAKKFIRDMGNYKKNHYDEYIEYLKYDCLALYESLEKLSSILKENFGLNFPSLTVASQAFKVFKTNFLEREIYTPTDKEDKFLRGGYYGGRVQYIGDGDLIEGLYRNCSMIDVNSMYPNVMQQDYPIGELYFIKTGEQFLTVVEKNKGKIPYGMYYCKFDLSASSFKYPPFIASKSKIGYNYGWKSEGAYLTHEDLEYCTENGGTYDVISGYYCLEVYPVFKRYIDFFYAIKSEENQTPAMIAFAKYMLNSLYGKFGQKLVREVLTSYRDSNPIIMKKLGLFNKLNDTQIESIHDLEEYDFLDNPKYPSRLCDDIISFEEQTPPARNQTNVIIAAYVTARARLNLHREMEKHDVIYIDTDSLITQSKIVASIGEKLGQWSYEKIKINGETVGVMDANVDVDVKGKKNYTVFYKNEACKNKHKGVSKMVINPLHQVGKAHKFFGYSLSPTGFKTWTKNKDINPSKFVVKKRRLSRQKPSEFVRN